jgi:hypothetical protein
VTARKPAACGEPGGYQKHRRDGTEVCQACRDAWNDYGRERVRTRKLLREARNAAAARREAREAAEQAARARLEDPVLAAHFAGELVLG